MNINQQWIDALESSKFTQATACLSRPDEDGVIGHCCLGVLAEVMNAPRYRDENETLYVQLTTPDVAFENLDVSSSMLDDTWFATTTGLDVDTHGHLAYCNDNGATFTEIAQALRSDNPQAAIAEMADQQRYAPTYDSPDTDYETI